MKTTMSTLKSFIRKNTDSLVVKMASSFDGMTDCVQSVQDSWRKVTAENAIGHRGVYCVGSSRDYITPFETNTHVGFEVSNCCGHGFLAIAK